MKIITGLLLLAISGPVFAISSCVDDLGRYVQCEESYPFDNNVPLNYQQPRPYGDAIEAQRNPVPDSYDASKYNYGHDERH